MTASGPTPVCCTFPRSELAQVLTLIWRALKPGGVFYASFKAGDGDGRDTLNRYYNYPSPEWLRDTYASAGSWSSLAIEKRRSQRLRRANGPRCCSSCSEDRRPKAPSGRCFASPGSAANDQTILKIASASTACAKKPTVKASVRNTGRPIV